MKIPLPPRLSSPPPEQWYFTPHAFAIGQYAADALTVIAIVVAVGAIVIDRRRAESDRRLRELDIEAEHRRRDQEVEAEWKRRDQEVEAERRQDAREARGRIEEFISAAIFFIADAIRLAQVRDHEIQSLGSTIPMGNATFTLRGELKVRRDALVGLRSSAPLDAELIVNLSSASSALDSCLEILRADSQAEHQRHIIDRLVTALGRPLEVLGQRSQRLLEEALLAGDA